MGVPKIAVSRHLFLQQIIHPHHGDTAAGRGVVGAVRDAGDGAGWSFSDSTLDMVSSKHEGSATANVRTATPCSGQTAWN